MTFNPSTILAVGLGGATGAILRFYVATQVFKYFPNTLQLATLIVNITGSFFIGILVGLFMHYTPSDILKLFLITGFLGALTTYSTFAIESYMLLNSQFWYGILNIILNLFGTIISAGLGYKLILNIIK
ncbi:MAG: CrcB family protein [Campylobacterota bacterium]|nr:CrcB family protein [Campylobacterota bacterium]